MNNITVCTVFVILFFTQSVSARENVPGNYAFSLNPCFGMVYGHSEELVYPSDTKAALLSELLWNIKPVFYYGLQLDFSRTRPTEQRGFFSNLSIKFGIPRSSGNMEDRDWQSIENDALTNYSIHDNFTREMFLFNMSAGYAFPVQQIMLLKIYVSVSYMNFRFSGSDGYLIYAREKGDGLYYPIYDNPIRDIFNGKVINYTQEWLTAAPGVSFGYYFFENFFAELSFQISPMVFCTDLDEHLHPSNKFQYKDYMRGGLFIEPGAALFLTCNERIALSLEFSWRYIGRTKGNTYQRPYKSGEYEQIGTAGAGLSIFDTGLFLRITL